MLSLNIIIYNVLYTKNLKKKKPVGKIHYMFEVET